MKKVYLFVIVLAVGFVLLQSAEANPRGAARSFASAAHFSAPMYRSAPSRSFSSAPPRYSAGPRISSTRFNRSYVPTRPRFNPTTTVLRNPTYVSRPRQFSGNRTAAFNSRTLSRSNAQLGSGNRTLAHNSQQFAQGRVVARHSANNWHRNWNRGRDHWWHGHRCHFRNGFWFIYDPWPLYPFAYGYGYYPYGGYYDATYYDDGTYAADEYATAPDSARSEYDGDSQISDVQSALAREGYYDGAIDGTIGPATRNALRRFQRDHRLEVTGRIDSAVIQALRLR